MNYIGDKIKELRHKNDMTQEKLADYLCVSYQSVSKWETGVTSPDLSLIVPLARLFKVTTDELFGIDGENGRRYEFDEAYQDYWKKDKDEMYKMAGRAVAEFPGDFKYLEWLASMEYYIAFDDDYRSGGSLDFFKSMLEKSRKHYETIVENCTDKDIREKAIYGIVLDLKYLGRLDEARKYAEMFPNKQGYTRDMILEMCLEGDELLAIRQKNVHNELERMLGALVNIWQFENRKSIYTKTALDIEEAIIHSVISDKNYLGFNWYLYQLYIGRAECCMADGEHDNAVVYLAKAKKHAQENDKLHNGGKHRYTCTILDRYEGEWKDELLPDDSMDYWKMCIQKSLFDPIRSREDFITLYQD